MEWHDDGLMIGTRAHGETALIASVFTRGHGLVRGRVRGVRARGHNPWQPGSRVSCCWRGRLAEQLGYFQFELLQPVAAALFPVPERLTALFSLTALLQLGLGEGEAHPVLYDRTHATVLALLTDDWMPLYALWELHLLDELGFGLDLAVCAVTGGVEDLGYVSPRTGRAVCRAVGEPLRERLFRYPPFWTAGRLPTPAEAAESLQMTAHFLTTRLLQPLSRKLPEARIELQGYTDRWRGGGG